MCNVEDFSACTLGSDASLIIKLLCLEDVSVSDGLDASGGVGGDMGAHMGAGVVIGLGLCVGVDLVAHVGAGVSIGLGLCGGVDLIEGEDASLGVGGYFALYRSLAM